MIVFDLDGTLADCNHRRHFVTPEFDEDAAKEYNEVDRHGIPLDETKFRWFNSKGEKWTPDWDSFYEDCDKDTPIDPVIEILITLWLREEKEIEIWSGRSDVVRNKTISWLHTHIFRFGMGICPIKMRPIGDSTPDDELKEMWLHDAKILEGKTIDFVFDDRPKVVRMWRRHGIFVFDCNQTGVEF